jgi:MFS transporter, PPP family, 3-phenylpropionic acid transporter
VLFLVVGCYLPYMPVWFHWRRSGARRTVLIFLAWGTLLSFLLLWASGGFWQMLFATLLVAFNWTTIMPLIEAFALSGVRTAGLDYGSVRLWGSGSFILASFGAGLVIGAFGAGSVLPLLVGASALMVVGIHLLPRDVASRSSPSPPPLRRISFADTVKLAHSLSFLLFLLAASMIQASHPLYYAFGTLYWRAQGLADGTIGALWALGVIAEIGLFAASGRILAKWGAPPLLLAAGIAAAAGGHGFRSAALGDDGVAVPARNELRRWASCRDVFPEPSRARGSRRHRARRLCRGGRGSGSRRGNHRLWALPEPCRRGLRDHGFAGPGRCGECRFF